MRIRNGQPEQLQATREGTEGYRRFLKHRLSRGLGQPLLQAGRLQSGSPGLRKELQISNDLCIAG
jgi:hypothetical protein